MHSSRMRTACGSSCLLGGGGSASVHAGIPPSRCGPGDPQGVGLWTPQVWAWRTPGRGLDTPSVGLETPLGVGLEPPRCGPGAPQAKPLNSPPGCGPGDHPSCGPEDPLCVGLETPWVWSWSPPRPDPSTSPWVWAWRPAMHAGIPLLTPQND